MLPHDGEAVRGEREDAVERLFDLRITQCGNEFPRFMPRRCEVFLGERQHRRHRLAGGVGHQRRHVDGHRLVAVGPDAHAVDVFAEVQILVLVAQDRQPGFGQFGVASDEGADLTGPRVLVGHRHQRDDEADLLGQLRTPEACRADHDVGFDDAGIRMYARHASACLDDAEHFGVRTERRAPCGGLIAPAPRPRAPPSPVRRRACGIRRGCSRGPAAGAFRRIRSR